MSQLTIGVNATETLWTVDAVPDPEFGFYTVGSEIVQVIAGFPGSDPGYAVGQTFPSKVRVIRATNDTSASSHLAGVALTAANAFAGGAEVIVYRQASDPGAVGPGMLWIDTSTDNPTTIKIRNALDDGWLPLIAAYASGTIGFERDFFGMTLATSGAIQLLSGGSAHMEALTGGVGQAGDNASIKGGNGDDGNVDAASLSAGGGGAVNPGEAQIKSAGSTGSGGQAIVAKTADQTAVWGGVKVAASGASGTPTGVLPFHLNTANAYDLYVWDGAAWRGTYRATLVVSAIPDLAMTVSDPPTQTQVQEIADKVDLLLGNLRIAGILAT